MNKVQQMMIKPLLKVGEKMIQENGDKIGKQLLSLLEQMVQKIPVSDGNKPGLLILEKEEITHYLGVGVKDGEINELVFKMQKEDIINMIPFKEITIDKIMNAAINISMENMISEDDAEKLKDSLLTNLSDSMNDDRDWETC